MLSNWRFPTTENWQYLIGSTLCHFMLPLLDKEGKVGDFKDLSLHNVGGFNGTKMGHHSAQMFSTGTMVGTIKKRFIPLTSPSKHRKVCLLLVPTSIRMNQDPDFFL